MRRKYKWTPFVVYVPNRQGDGVLHTVPITIKVRWDAEVREWIVTPEGHKVIDDTKRRFS